MKVVVGLPWLFKKKKKKKNILYAPVISFYISLSPSTDVCHPTTTLVFRQARRNPKTVSLQKIGGLRASAQLLIVRTLRDI